MKHKRSIGKTMLSICLAIMLVLQTVAFPAAALANDDSGSLSVVESQSTSEVVDDATGELPSDNSSSEAEEVSDPSDETSENNLPPAEEEEEANDAAEEPSSDSPTLTPEAESKPQANSMVGLMAVDPSDKTAVFMDANAIFPLKVTQGTEVAPGGTIQGRQAFTLTSEGLKVPVMGDYVGTQDQNDTTKYLQKGDFIELKRDTYFKEVVLPTATRTLNATTENGVKQLGTVYFTPNSIRIVFNGDDLFFNGIGKAVTFSFDTTANSDVTGLNYGDSKPISIFGGAYQLKNPDVTPAYSITLSSPGMVRWDQYSYRGIQPAQFVEGAVTWQSNVSSSDKFDNTVKLPLDGKVFYTNPSVYNTGFGNVQGIYMEDSFKVNDQNVTPVIGADGSLTYTFPEGTGLDPKVEYKTWIPKEAYYYEYRTPPGNLGRSHRDMQGKVELRQDATMLVNTALEISFAPDWIQASASYDHSNEMITWKVVVNQYNKRGLQDFTITNVLPAGLEFTSATWQTMVDGNASEVQAIVPDASGTYSFGEINGRVELLIQSKVISGSNFQITPRTNWNLATPGGIQNNNVTAGTRPSAVTDEASVTVGAHAFTKTGAVSTEDYNLGGITWTVNLNPQYALPNAAVYDVLVHGGNLNVLDNAMDETGEVSADTIAKIKGNINNAQLWSKYQEGTLKTNASGLTMKSIPLTVDGKVVADLIKVTGYTEAAASFSFRALETNTDVLFKQDINTGKSIWNRALLIDGETVIQAQNNANLHLRMLNKDMLYASKPLKADGTPENVSPNNVGSYIRNDNNDAWTISGYDRITKTVTFRLGVNMPGYNTEEMAKDGGNRVISNIKLVDTLPEGWEFVPYSEGKDFELWKGFSDNSSGTEYGTRNDARTVIEPGTAAHVVNFSHSGNVGTFTFSKLESPYIILVKARPSNEALAQYIEDYTTNGTDKQVMYNKADLHMTWGGEEKVVTEQRKIIVPIQTLGKSVTKPVPGVLEWTVNYTPPFNMQQGAYLQDTLGAGMNLRYEVDGKLVLSAPSMAVYPATLTASGALERTGAALDLSDPNAEVQVEAAPGVDGTTVLLFKMDDPNKFYQFVYQTEVDPTTAKAGDKMGNEVKLMGDDKLKSVSARSESTLDSSDVAGTSTSNALLPLRKVDPNNNPLKDVEFTLYKKSNGDRVTDGTTNSEGKLNLLIPDPGYYELKETYIDTTTWLPMTKIYQVYVGNTPGKPIWVDGIKVNSELPLIVPTPAQGKLTINNTVQGNGSDPSKVFEYTVNFDGEGKDEEYAYTKSDGTSSKIKSGDKITLKHGESVTLAALPADLVYTVTEADYTTSDGYTTTPETREYSGTVVNKGDHKADFINERIVNKLTISNTVMGNGGDPTKEFEYTVILEDAGKDGSYTYEKSDGSTGMIKSRDTFRLKDGETLDLVGLPKHLKYTITQQDYTDDDYVTNPEERYYTGVMDGKDEVAPYTNIRMLKGGLLISNTVKGKDDDKQKPFTYTITFTGAGADESYVYVKSDGSTGVIRNGDTFELTDGQTLGVQDLPTNLDYTVTQEDYTTDGYVTDPGSFVRTGTIPEKQVSRADYVNTRPYLEGILRNNNTGEVIPNAPITVTDLKTGEKIQTVTNENGEYAVPAVADTDYTITYTKLYRVGGKDVPVEFTQKANVDGSVTDETVPADITAVGIVLFKQLNGTTELFNDEFISHMHIYLKNSDGTYIEENGRPKAFPMASNGTFSVEGLSEQKYIMEVRYESETGEELLLKVAQLDVKANGELNISEELVDPYGTVYDETTGDATTGKKIEGAIVTLYYADTQRNRDKGRIPGTKVTLPAVPNFPPHDNKSPEQDSDANGFYAYMVFPEADYYLIVTKDGYETHRSDTISVDFDIVRYDVPMRPIRSSGGNNGGGGTTNPGNGTSDPGNGTTDPGNGTTNPGQGTTEPVQGTTEPVNGTTEPVNGTTDPINGTTDPVHGTTEPDHGATDPDNGTIDPVDGTPEPSNGVTNPVSDNTDPDTGTTNPGKVNNDTDNGNHEVNNVSNELDDAPKTGDNSVTPMIYMALALMSLMTIVLCLFGNKKKKHFQ
ncbi:carboxypeptidase regulatory-like domain-containing protein [Paenibacillus sp. MER 99-2]|uniref:DUF7601 domain-containing protein n=1 Tax=Paenibacillus sp. MER 99-2 TaxID=2939572 RepID=UPI00204122E7|nr:carboxypeptidase regulatory-like domain-containing protein [Paenibacillus sp. MER 99-2]MCM3173618.1 SpaA isopeptide-forming pilin-related protein [Paenibacillus sp. MER 99-2]